MNTIEDEFPYVTDATLREMTDGLPAHTSAPQKRYTHWEIHETANGPVAYCARCGYKHVLGQDAEYGQCPRCGGVPCD